MALLTFPCPGAPNCQRMDVIPMAPSPLSSSWVDSHCRDLELLKC